MDRNVLVLDPIMVMRFLHACARDRHLTIPSAVVLYSLEYFLEGAADLMEHLLDAAPASFLEAVLR